METRVCTICNEVKQIDNFYSREYRCKPCMRQIAKEKKRKNNPELIEKERLSAQGKRKCTKCLITKSIDAFYIKNSRCKECVKNKTKLYVRENNPRLVEKEKLEKGGKRRCKKCNLIKELTIENFTQAKSKTTGLKVFRGTCRVCYKEQVNKSRRKLRSDPEYRRAELDKDIERRARIIAVRDKEKIVARKREKETGLRVCKICKEEKPFSEYQKNGIGAKGQQLYERRCTECSNARIQKWRKDNYEERFAYRKKYREENAEKLKAKAERYYNSEEGQKVRLEYIEKNKPKRNRKLVEKRKNDPVEALAHNLRSRTAHAFSERGYTKRSKTYTYLGISFEDLKKYIENKFEENMSWDNRDDWHIDHIIPLAAAENVSELIALCYHKNLEPIWEKENLQKSDNYDPKDKEAYLKWYYSEFPNKKP